ncbi:hypothetical protein [Actinacidiphila oryziradicis]|uniref:Uncharacterized protein n=1 Tax=Actinacidiphila oryziradicis TaxID=2571141 RepID=A0A4U0SUD3_9ACTN|nr:hypothetical protein [Actinacidiphila oryziradicis]TKA13168.1 hypothetical protein FCI23_00010 [Actinacidiphila oryziradicis]
MNGHEHYQRAEELAEKVSSGRAYADAIETAMLAQVHATLALAAATADATNFRRDLYAGNGDELPATTARKKNFAAKSADAANDFI